MFKTKLYLRLGFDQNKTNKRVYKRISYDNDFKFRDITMQKFKTGRNP